MPDIDVDFDYIQRGEVIEYVKRRYGSDHVAQIVTFGTMAAKGAIRDVGRVLNMPYAQVADIAKLVPNELKMTLDKALETSADFRKAYEGSEEVHRLVDLARKIEGLPRHSSTHAAGVVIARHPLTDYVPVSMSDGTLVTEYDKDHVEELGLLKMDFLGLRTLTVITDAVKNIKKNRGETLDINSIPLVDDETSKMLCEGKTGAVFQMESSGMTALVKDLAPQGFADLIPTVALYRPGPLGSGMVEDFIGGRHGTKEVHYLHPLLEPILKETFGVVLYQEQVMQIVQVLAGFTLGQADLLRRAMGKKKAKILLGQKENFLAGCKKNGIEMGLANTIFDLLTHFADYGFNKSHSAAYALVAWQTAYLKAHYPQEFMAAMLTSVMDTDKVAGYIEQCRRMGIPILPPDINASEAYFTVDGTSIRFGLAAVRNVGENALKGMIAERQAGGPFRSLVDFCSRVNARTLSKRAIESLIRCGAFDSLGARRSQLLAVLDKALGEAARKQRDAQNGQMGLFGEEVLDEAAELDLPDIYHRPSARPLRGGALAAAGHPHARERRRAGSAGRARRRHVHGAQAHHDAQGRDDVLCDARGLHGQPGGHRLPAHVLRSRELARRRYGGRRAGARGHGGRRGEAPRRPPLAARLLPPCLLREDPRGEGRAGDLRCARGALPGAPRRQRRLPLRGRALAQDGSEGLAARGRGRQAGA